MAGSSQKEKLNDRSSGVSETIGAVLLVSLVVLAVGIVSVVLLSQPTPEETPNVHFITGTNAGQTKLFIYHDGGDILPLGEFYLVVDGERKDPVIQEGGNEWSVGKTLVVDNPPPPPWNIQIVYTGSGTGTVLIDQTDLRPVVTSTLVPDVRLTPIIPPSCVDCDWLVDNCTEDQITDAITRIIRENSVNFYREPNKNKDNLGGQFSFKVNDTSGRSSIFFSGSADPRRLNYGDVVSVTIDKKNEKDFRIFGITPAIWELTASDVDLSINTIHYNKVDIYHTWVADYDPGSLHSTLTITSDPDKNANTVLIINYTERINGINDSVIILENVRPLPLGLFLVQTDHNLHSIYFVGNADCVRVDGTCIH